MISTILLTSVVFSAPTPFYGPKIIKHDGKCVGVNHWLDLYSYDCDGEDDQLWTYDGYQLQNVDYSNLCLTADRVSSPKLRQCNGASDQNWAVSDDSIFLRDPKWHEIRTDDIDHTLPIFTDLALYNDENNRLIIDGTLKERGCGGEQSGFAVFFDDIDNQKWHSIDYTMEFITGAFSCWSIFGNTHFGDFEIDSLGIYEFDANEGDKVIFNELSYGEWDGETRRNDNEANNPFHGQHHGFWNNKGSIRVEQRRDMSASQAGIGAGFSCVKPGTIVRFKDIRVAYYDDDNSGSTVLCLAEDNDELVVKDCGGTSSQDMFKWEFSGINIYDYPDCRPDCLVDLGGCPSSYGNCHQIEGAIYRVDGKCYMAIGRSWGALHIPGLHPDLLQPVSCSDGKEIDRFEVFDYPDCYPWCLRHTPICGTVECHQKPGTIYRVDGTCYKAIDDCWGCLNNPLQHTNNLKPVLCSTGLEYPISH